MGYQAVAATVDIAFECEHCGASGIVNEEGTEMIDRTFACLHFNCPQCGEVLEEER